MRVLTASDHALLVEADDLDEAMRLSLAWSGMPEVAELVPGARTVLVRFDPLRVSAETLARRLAGTRVDAAHLPAAREVTIPVRYDGEDLGDVAGLLGVSAEEVVARHLAAEWRVAFSGFAPGFGYAVSSDPLFDVPRRASPRTRVPAGSVALAGPFTGVYPRASPGGWQLIGRTDAVMWDIDRDPPALLAPGTLVRFARAGRDAVISGGVPEGPDARPESSATGARAGARLEVVRSGLQLLVQDRGRPGRAALGVSASGVADRTAMRVANRAVGNRPDAAILEGVGAMTLRLHGDGVAAVTGAVGEFSLTGADGVLHAILPGAPFAFADGDLLTLEHPVRGLRYAIAVRGGIVAAPALGSVATDTLAGLGPTPLTAGDTVRFGDMHDAPFAVDPYPTPRDLPAAGDVVELRITLGPRDDWFTPDALLALCGQDWEVTPRSDRVGVRLHGETPLSRSIAGELPSEGAVTGAIQVPPDGQPVLFLPDHPLTGGYPIIGALTDDSLDLAAQLPPGARIRFVASSRTDAPGGPA